MNINFSPSCTLIFQDRNKISLVFFAKYILTTFATFSDNVCITKIYIIFRHAFLGIFAPSLNTQNVLNFK